MRRKPAPPPPDIRFIVRYLNKDWKDTSNQLWRQIKERFMTAQNLGHQARVRVNNDGDLEFYVEVPDQ